MNRLLVVVAISVLLCPSYAVTAQTSNLNRNDISPTTPTRVVNEGGWEVAGLSKRRIVERKRLESPGDEPIYIAFLKLSDEVVTQIPIFWLTEAGATLHTKQQGVAVRFISRYDINSRVFCYSLRGVGAFYDKKTRHGGYGGKFILIYYDNDGDGKFETFELGNSALPFTPAVPAWALKNPSITH